MLKFWKPVSLVSSEFEKCIHVVVCGRDNSCVGVWSSDDQVCRFPAFFFVINVVSLCAQLCRFPALNIVVSLWSTLRIICAQLCRFPALDVAVFLCSTLWSLWAQVCRFPALGVAVFLRSTLWILCAKVCRFPALNVVVFWRSLTKWIWHLTKISNDLRNYRWTIRVLWIVYSTLY